ncbi:hypothetical protein SESBI_33161 [Sesbania bispinosa]|nr:hypothetical protein SESBI_33161 [Sesbania bispinosa]
MREKNRTKRMQVTFRRKGLNPTPENQDAENAIRTEPIISSPLADQPTIEKPLAETQENKSDMNKESEVPTGSHPKKETEVTAPSPTPQVNIA